MAKSCGISRKWKLIISSIIYYCNFSMGFGSAFIPASLLELSKKFETDISTVSKVFAIMTFSFLLGAIMSGFLLNCINRKVSTPFMFITLGIVGCVIPHSPSLPIFFGLACVGGVMCALYSTAQVVWIIDLWQKDAALYIQIQHFCFALGAVFSPLTMKFFLPHQSPSGDLNSVLENATTDGVIDLQNRVNDLKPTADLYIPFLIGGLTAVVGGLLLGIPYCFSVEDEGKPEKCAEQEKINFPEVEIEPAKAKNGARIILILLSATVLGAYQGMEVCSFQFIPTFTQFIALKLSQPEGSLVLAALAMAFTLGRGFGILVILKIRPQVLLVANIVLVLLGNSLLLTLGNTSMPALWTGAILLGLGFSTLVPSYYGFIEKHMKVSNMVGAAMGVASGLAPTIYPIIIGSHIELTPFILLYTNYFSLVLCATAFCIIYVITQRNVKGAKVDNIYEAAEKVPFEPNDNLYIEIPLNSKEFDT